MSEQCPFCNLDPDRIRLETEFGLAVVDLVPLTSGHMLVIPRQHVESVYDLPEDQQQGLWALTREVRDLLTAQLEPDGFTIGLSEGIAAGQTLFHAHIHVIPRRLGDVSDPTGGLRAIFPNKARYREQL
jgi:diadenosine tetraphosphate (Ap4A) HIT family hydrolase